MIKGNLTYLLAALICCNSIIIVELSGQGWEHVYSYVSYNNYDILETNDAGFITAGITNSPNDVILIKTDAQGDILWQKTYEVPNNDAVEGLVQLGDNGFAFTGSNADWGGANHAWASLTRTDSLGNELWTKYIEIDYPVPYDLFGSQGTAITETDDGGLVFTSVIWGDGFTFSHIIKTDLDGNQMWFKNI